MKNMPLISKQEVEDKAKKLGFTASWRCYDQEKQDVTLYANDSYVPLVQFRKDRRLVEVLPVGTVRVTRKTDKKTFSNHNDDIPPEVLEDVVAHDDAYEWENNNWFEVNTDGSSYKGMEEPFDRADDAIQEALTRLKNISVEA